MKFEQATLRAMRRRAEATGAWVMTIDQIERDLGCPADFVDVLEALHARGLIKLHRYTDTLTLLERGRAHPQRA